MRLDLFFPEEQCKTSCPRCRFNIRYIRNAQILLANVQKIVRKDIRAICDLCRKYKANMCYLCTKALKNFSDANIEHNIKIVSNNFKPEQESFLTDKNICQTSTNWGRTFLLRDQLFSSEPSQFQSSPLFYEENNKLSLENQVKFDTTSSVLKREYMSLTDIINKIPNPINNEFLDKKECKVRKNQIYSKKSLPNIFTDAEVVPLFETRPFIVKENETPWEKLTKMCDIQVHGMLSKEHNSPLQIKTVSNIKQLANNMKKNYSVMFQECESNILSLPTIQNDEQPFCKSEIKISNAKEMLKSKTKPYIEEKRNTANRKFDEKCDLAIHKSLPKLQDTLPPLQIVNYTTLVLMELQLVANSKFSFESTTIFSVSHHE